MGDVSANGRAKMILSERNDPVGDTLNSRKSHSTPLCFASIEFFAHYEGGMSGGLRLED